MRNLSKTLVITLIGLMLTGPTLPAKNHSEDYQMGTFISVAASADGTITSTLHGDGTTVAGDVYANHVTVYAIKVPNGTWYVTTLNQSQDSMLRGMGMTPMHFKSEKANPLDGLKSGDRVLFRLHEKHYLNGKSTLMAIPYADNPNKEVEFTTRFAPDVAPVQTAKPTDNVKAMCDSDRLSPQLRTQYCASRAPLQQPVASAIGHAETQNILTNKSIVDMVNAGVPNDKIVSEIRASTTHFDMATIGKLMQDAPGISASVINEMVASWARQQ
jgi:hypothetical protein